MRPHAGLSNLQLDVSTYVSRKTQLTEPLHSELTQGIFQPN